MSLPADNPRARVLWSIPAAAIILLWTLGVLAAGATTFTDACTFPEALGAVAANLSHALWPGEFGHSWPWLQVSPLIAAALWSACLVPWRRHAARIAALVAAMLIPAWFILFAPWIIPFGAFMVITVLFGPTSGEEYQDGALVFPAMGLWWCFLIPLIVATVKHRPLRLNECPSCGYCTRGLRGGICPECGVTLRRAGHTPG